MTRRTLLATAMLLAALALLPPWANTQSISGGDSQPSGGAIPVLSLCGTGPPVVDIHGNNRSGTITAGAGILASCTMTFGAPGYSSWNHCRVTPHVTLAAFAYSYTLTTLTITGTSITSAVVDYNCDGV